MPDQCSTSQHKVGEVLQIILIIMIKRDVQQLLTSRQCAQQRRTAGKAKAKTVAMEEAKKTMKGSNVSK